MRLLFCPLEYLSCALASQAAVLAILANPARLWLQIYQFVFGLFIRAIKNNLYRMENNILRLLEAHTRSSLVFARIVFAINTDNPVFFSPITQKNEKTTRSPS